jgi:hypothetical protein
MKYASITLHSISIITIVGFPYLIIDLSFIPSIYLRVLLTVFYAFINHYCVTDLNDMPYEPLTQSIKVTALCPMHPMLYELRPYDALPPRNACMK